MPEAYPHDMPDDEFHRPETWPTGRLLSTAARLVEHAWSDGLARLGVTHAGLIVLHLLDFGSRSQTELARLARVENQTMSRTLERLERIGYVERRPDPADRRRHLVSRTDAGRHAWEAARSLEEEIFPDIADADRLRALLLEIVTAAERERWRPTGTG